MALRFSLTFGPRPVRAPLIPPDAPAAGPATPLGRTLHLLATPLRAYVRAWRRIRPTREGWIFVTTALAVAAAALNTGNNLLYLVFAAMLSLLVLSGILSESSLRGVRVQRRIDERVYAGRPARGTWVVSRARRRLPALALDLEEIPGRHARLREHGFVTVPYLPGGGEARRTGEWTFDVRGIHRLGRVRVSTTWPFGILRKWFEVELPADVLVFPAPAADHAGALIRQAGRDGGTIPRARRGATGDVRGLRDHRVGEDLRTVHWRTSARLRRRVAVERDAEEGGRYEVRVERPPPGGGSEREREAGFERSVSRATGAIVAATERGDEVVLRVGARALPAASGRDGRDRLLGRLAVLRMEDA